MNMHAASDIRDSPFIAAREYAARIEALRARMQQQKIDAVLLGTGMNLQYFSGFPSPQKNVARPFFLLIPYRGALVLFAHTALMDECRRFAAVDEIRPYADLSHVPVDLLRDALADAGIRAGRIGMELGFEQSLDISPLEFNRLRDSLQHAELCDVASMLWELRMIKSEAEIDCMRNACDIVADAYSNTFRTSYAGMREREIYGTMLEQLHTSGGDTFLVITSGRGNYDLISKPPEGRIIEEGDMVWMDAGCRVGGYWSDYSRAAIAGQPSDIQKRTQAEIHAITADTVRQIRPGARCSEIARYALHRLDNLSFPLTSSIAARAARIGHGIGLTMTEPPHLGLHDDTVLQAGMVVSVEPGIATEHGTFHVEENVVVRDGECELLSTAPRTLQRLEAFS